MTLEQKYAFEQIVNRYKSGKIGDIELCSDIEGLFPERSYSGKWKELAISVEDIIGDYCPELYEITLYDIIMWRCAVENTISYIEESGCILRNKAEIISCAIHMAKHYRVDPHDVINSCAIREFIEDTKYDMITRIDVEGQYPGIHKYYRNGHHAPVSTDDFCDTINISDELKGMLCHICHRDTYCDESTGMWRIQGTICGAYFRLYENALRSQINNVNLCIQGVDMCSTSKPIEYRGCDVLIITFTVPCKK